MNKVINQTKKKENFKKQKNKLTTTCSYKMQSGEPGKDLEAEGSSARYGRWTKKEDLLLKYLVSKHGIINLSIIKKEFNGSRNIKQIRDRWVNHLDPSIIKKRKFNEEEIKIIEKYKFKWAKIAKLIPGSTQLMVKNFYYNNLRKKRKENNRLLTLATIACSHS